MPYRILKTANPTKYNKYTRGIGIASKVLKYFGPDPILPKNLQRTYNWELLLPDIGNIKGTSLTEYCQEVRFGDYTIGDLSQMNYGARKLFFAGKLSISAITIVFVKPTNDIVSDFFYTWREKVISSEGYYSPKNHYSRPIYVMLHDRSGQCVDKFGLIGAFPTTLPTYDLQYGTEDIIKLSVELSIDNIERVKSDNPEPNFMQILSKYI